MTALAASSFVGKMIFVANAPGVAGRIATRTVVPAPGASVSSRADAWASSERRRGAPMTSRASPTLRAGISRAVTSLGATIPKSIDRSAISILGPARAGGAVAAETRAAATRSIAAACAGGRSTPSALPVAVLARESGPHRRQLLDEPLGRPGRAARERVLAEDRHRDGRVEVAHDGVGKAIGIDLPPRDRLAGG